MVPIPHLLVVGESPTRINGVPHANGMPASQRERQILPAGMTVKAATKQKGSFSHDANRPDGFPRAAW
jgi:hypothetical protein